MDKVCKIFNCKKTTLKVWVHNYQNNKNYVDYAYGTNKKTEYTRKPSTRKPSTRKPSTRKHKLKQYKEYIKLNKN